MKADDRRRLQGSRLAASRLAAGFSSAAKAANRHGWTLSTYRSHENGTRTIGQDDAEKYVRAFRATGADTTASKILFGSGREIVDEDQGDEVPIVGDAREINARFVRAMYGGTVEAGTFRAVDEFDDEAHTRPPIYAMVDHEFPDAKLVSFDVAGDSMNALQPVPIFPGQRVIGLEFESLRNRAPVRDGMVVIVEQTLNGGQLRERSVKQLQLYRDRTEYCPRSTNPRHKPIVVQNDHQADDGREVSILAVVRQITSEVKI